MPGFARALACTLQEIRLAGVDGDRLASLPLGGRDLSELLTRFDQQFAAASATDRATLFDTATRALQSGGRQKDGRLLLADAPLLLLDVPLDSPVEFAFVRALLDTRTSNPGPQASVLITVPFGDLAALKRLQSIGFEPEIVEQEGDSDLVALRRNLFATRQPPIRSPHGDVTFFSAPGEGRECVEIARRILQEARAGVRFDEMAVFLRAPQRYVGLLEHALGRAGVPAWFERGTRRPHPAGRAFLAILACACERLSARRFAEYLSLAQVPSLDDKARAREFLVPDDEALSAVADAASKTDAENAGRDEDSNVEPPSSPQASRSSDSDDEAIVHGMLRAPWKWETLIVESAVIGGDPARWHRRLNGLAKEFRVRIAEERKEDPESPRAARLERDWRNLGHLRAFALPIIDMLASWPSNRDMGEWLDRFAMLAPMVLRQPDRVLRVVAAAAADERHRSGAAR